MSYLIYINGQQVNEKAIVFTQTKQVNDIANLTSRNSNFTQSIKIPRTAVNVPIFQDAFNVGSQTTIPYTYVSCDVIDADTGQHVIYKGWAVLLESTPLEYSITIYDGAIDFYKRIDGVFITDVGVAELNHVKNIPNVIQTWTDPTLPYRYILADYNGNNDASGNINIDFQVPSASVSYLWNKIFAFIGWNFVGSIFTHEKFLNLWMSYPKPVSLATPITHLVANQESILFTNEVQYPIGSGGGAFYGSVTFVIFIQASAFNPTYYNVSGAVVAGLYRFTFTPCIFSLSNSSIPPSSHIQVTVRDSLNQIISDNSVDIALGNYLDIFLQVGQRVNIVAPFVGQVSPDIFQELQGSTTTTMSLVEGYSLGFDQAFINYKVSDFVREIVVRFGLTLFKDKYSNTIKFLTLSELLQNSVIDNWGTIFSRKLSEKYIFGSYAKSNVFKYKYNDDGMLHNDGYFNVSNKNLPEQFVLLNSQIYSPERLQSSFLGGCNIYKIWDKEIKDNNEVTYKDLDGRFYFLRADRVNAQKTLGSNILGGTQTNNFYFRESYYRLAFSEIINDWYRPLKAIFDKARLITVEVFLKPIDIYNFDFSRLVYVPQLSSNYIVNKISNFVKGRPTKVELIEVDYFTELDVQSPIDCTVEITNAVLVGCNVVLSILTDCPTPVNIKFVVYAGGLNNFVNLEFTEFVILPTQTQTFTGGTVSFSISQLPYNPFGYKFGVKLLVQNAFENIYSNQSVTVTPDGSCYVSPVLTTLAITSAVLQNTNDFTKTYLVTFASDVVLPVQLYFRNYAAPTWTDYTAYYATVNSFTVVVSSSVTKFQIKIGAVESAEFTI